MYAWLFRIWDSIRTSYWFWPAVLSIGAIVLSLIVTGYDTSPIDDWLSKFGWLYPTRPDGARALLATLASSMITTAGVTFSITIAAVAQASMQFGPRLLTNFMRDRGNQLTLGVFTATFVYCLMILRTITVSKNDEGAIAYVSQLPILLAVLMSLTSVGALIFFIHHIPESIHISNVTAKIGRDLCHRLNSLFPERLGHERDEGLIVNIDEVNLPINFNDNCRVVRAKKSGHIQALDSERLMELAVQHDLLIRLEVRPGEFASESESLLIVFPSDRVDDELARSLANLFAQGNHRTDVQDAGFLSDELVEIATRALSPGQNDPYTAQTCMDWLGTALICLATRKMPDARRFDDKGRLRVVAEPTTFRHFADDIFNQLRPYVRTDANAAVYLLKVIHRVAKTIDEPTYRPILLAQADALLEACRISLPNDKNLAQIEAAASTL